MALECSSGPEHDGVRGLLWPGVELKIDCAVALLGDGVAQKSVFASLCARRDLNTRQAPAAIGRHPPTTVEFSYRPM